MDSEIKEVIEKHLPSQVGDVLKRKLQESDRNANELESMRNKAKEYREKFENAEKTINKQQEEIKRHGEINKREKELLIMEERRASFELQCRLNSAEMVNNKIMDFISGLMRNTEFRKTKWNEYTSNYNSSTGLYENDKLKSEEEKSQIE